MDLLGWSIEPEANVNLVGWTAMIVTCSASIAAAVVSIINAIRVPQKINEVETKIDDNTKVTKEGAAAAVENAKVAAVTATAAKTAAVEMKEEINKKLNGGMDELIASAVDPIKTMLDDHTYKIEKLDAYTHERNHNIVNALQTLTTQVATLLEFSRKQQEQQVRQNQQKTT